MLTSVEFRHIMHENPEPAFQEYKTTELLIQNISELPSEKLKIRRPIETGLLVEYRVKDGPFLLFRCDLDALEIREKTDCPFKSQNGFMHACGHDIHTAILYGFLKYAVENNIDKNILFLFQPAEETGLGAKKIIESKILENYNISSAFALHLLEEYPHGTVASTRGVLFASAMEIDVEFFGQNAHVAFPQQGKNAFNALRLFLDVVDKIPKNTQKPLIYGTGKVIAGEVRNIIPSYAKSEGTIRCLNSKSSIEFYEQLKTIVNSIKIATGVKGTVLQGAFCPEVIVNGELYDKARKIISREYKFIDCGYKMTGEDFGYISHLYPSFMFWLGCGKEDKHGLHNPCFFPDDSVIDTGIEVYKLILEI